MDSGSSDVDKQAKQNHKKSGECSPAFLELSSLPEYQLNWFERHNKLIFSVFVSEDVGASSGAGGKAPLVASDSSSSGGSDSEEDDKNAGGPPNAITPCVPGNKTADLKRLACFSLSVRCLVV